MKATTPYPSNPHAKKWQENNREKFLSMIKQVSKRHRETLSDSYVTYIAVKRGIKKEEITPEVIESVRQSLIEKRERWANKTPNQKKERTHELTTIPGYMRREQVCSYLRICVRTLQLWKKQGKLSPIKQGGKVYYKEEDVKSIIK